MGDDSGTKKNMYERILQANAKIKDYNFGDLLAKMQSENPEIQEVAYYNFLVSSRELIKSYLSREDIANLFEIDKNNYNSRSSKYSNEYKGINTLSDNVEDVLQQFYAEIPSIENLDENIIYEFAKTAFWSNKATKICGQSIGTIILDSFDVLYNDNEENRNKVLDNSNEWVKDLYNKYSTLKEIEEKRKQLSISTDQESNEFKQKRKLLERQENVIKNEIISNVKSIFENYYKKISKGDYQAEKDFYTNYKFFEKTFKKYSNIKQSQKMNYFIKSVSIRQLFKLLVKDNYNKYKDWGFYDDVK